MNKRIVLGIVFLIAIGSVVFVKGNIEKAESVDITDENLGIATKVIMTENGNLEKKINYIGTIASSESMQIASLVSADVESINVGEGDRVEKGHIIGALDDSKLQNKLETALNRLNILKEKYDYLEAEVNQYYVENSNTKKIENLIYEYTYLTDELEKYTALYKEGIIAKSDYDKFIHDKDLVAIQLESLKLSSTTQYDQLVHERELSLMQIEELESEIGGIRNEIEETIIISPKTGIVRELYYEVGDLAMMGNPFVVIDEENAFVVNIDIVESDLKKLSENTRTLLIESDEIKWETRISKFPTRINPATRIGKIEVELPEDTQGFSRIIGSSVGVVFIVDEAINKVIIPQIAIKSQEDMQIVFVIEAGIARERVIETGIVFEDQVAVLSGLKNSEQLAYANVGRLYDGAKVFVFKGDE